MTAKPFHPAAMRVRLPSTPQARMAMSGLLTRLLQRPWQLAGWDTFAGHWYAIPGRYRSRACALRAARRELARIEKMQPTATSGGPDGIQDHVYIVGPDGARERVLR